MTAPRDASLEQALALGGYRTATAAHPDCVCGRTYLARCSACPAGPEQPCQPLADDPPGLDGVELRMRHRRPAERPGEKADCPQHRRGGGR